MTRPPPPCPPPPPPLPSFSSSRLLLFTSFPSAVKLASLGACSGGHTGLASKVLLVAYTIIIAKNEKPAKFL